MTKNRFLSNPDPGANLVSGNLVMETGCMASTPSASDVYRGESDSA